MPAPEPVQLPAARWEPYALEFEPAHGYFARLAARNSAHSVREFADSMGLNGKDFDLGELLAFCSQFPIRNVDALAAATPSRDHKFIRVNGQKFRTKTDWSVAKPRVCPGCLFESRHYRNWWDLTVISRCPIHNAPLLGGSGKNSLSWGFPLIGITPNGIDLAAAIERANTVDKSWNAYALGRMEVIESFAAPTLDASELHEVVAATELLGNAAIFGLRQRLGRRYRRANNEQRHHAISIGFGALLRGVDGVVGLLEECVRRGQTYKSDKLSQPSQRSLFGWFAAAVKLRPQCEAQQIIAAAFSSVAHRYDVSMRPRRKHNVSKKIIGLRPLAKQCGVSTTRLRALAEKCGLLKPGRRTGIYHSFDEIEVSEIKLVLQDLLSTKDAQRYVLEQGHDLSKLQRVGKIKPFINAKLSAQGFLKSELDAAICEAKSGKSRDVVESHARIGFRRRKHPARSGLSIGHTAALLGGRRILPSISHLVALEFLELEADACSSESGTRIDESSAMAFFTKFAPATLYADDLNCSPSYAYFELRKKGVRQIFKPDSRGVSFVERSVVRDVLHLEKDPDDPDRYPHIHFWEEMRNYLKAKASSVLIYVGPKGKTATLSTGDFKCWAHAELADDGDLLTIEFRCSATSQSRRATIFRSQIEKIRDAWGHDAKILDDRSAQTRVVRQRRRADIDDESCWHELFQWLDDRMMLLRSFSGLTKETVNGRTRNSLTPPVSLDALEA